MKLTEAKKILKQNGYLLEDADPYTDALADELDREVEYNQAKDKLEETIEEIVSKFKEEGFELRKINDDPIKYASYADQGKYRNHLNIEEEDSEITITTYALDTKAHKKLNGYILYLSGDANSKKIDKAVKETIERWNIMININRSLFKRAIRRVVGD